MSSSRLEKTSAKMSTYPASWSRVDGAELVRAWRSSTQVMSMPTCGTEGAGTEDGLGLANTVVGFGLAPWDCGMIVPARATTDAWWLTLNSMPGMGSSVASVRAGEGMKHGRR